MLNKNIYIIFFVIALSGSFFLYGGLLNPCNTNWLIAENDPQQSFLGWHFFRQEPWCWPLGALRSLGAPTGSSIVFTDSIPLVAFLLKIFHPIIPGIVQYLGVFMMVNFFLVLCLAFKLLRRFNVPPMICFLGACLALLQPAMIMRGIAAHGHIALSAHWLIFIAIDLFLFSDPEKKKTTLKWMLLLIISVLIHFYLFFMISFLWGGWLISCFFKDRKNPNRLPIFRWICMAIIPILIIAFVMWAAGYFCLGSAVGAGGFGYFSAELFTFFNPSSKAWFLQNQYYNSLSLIFKGWTTPISGQYEGQAYMGMGVIMAFAIALCVVLYQGTGKAIKNVSVRYKWLIFYSCLLFIFALGDHIIFLNYKVVSFDYPGLLKPITNALRSNGRCVWPLLYCVVLGTIVLISRCMPKKQAALFFSFAVLIQLLDVWPGISFVHSRSWDIAKLEKKEQPFQDLWKSELLNLWEEKNNIMILQLPQTDEQMYNLRPYSWIAALYGMQINYAYFARFDTKAYIKNTEDEIARLKNGVIRKDTVYLVIDDSLIPVVNSFKNTSQCKVYNNTLFWYMKPPQL